MNAMLQSKLVPAEAPVLIPTDAYLSETYARDERAKLWLKVWQVACREEELPRVGDYATYDILDESVTVVRTAADVISAYHNVCQHRGRRLTDGCGHAKRFACKFHGWKWNLDGSSAEVVRGEAYGGALEPHSIRLKPVRVGRWGGWVWINMDPDAEDLEGYLGEVRPMLDPFELDKMRYRWRQWLRYPCNWKVAIEAFNEGYHLLGTHPQLARNSPKPTWSRVAGLHGCFGSASGEGLGGASSGVAGAKDMRVAFAEALSQLWEEANATTTETMVEVAKRLVDELPESATAEEVQAHFVRRAVEEDAKRGVIWPQIDPAHFAASGLGWHVFPNTVIIHGPTFALCYRARPDGYDPNSCIFEVYALQRFPEGQEPAPENQHRPTIDEESWRRLLCQDFSNMSEVQRGMKSSAFAGARPHPQEEQTIINFHRSLAQYMGAGALQPLARAAEDPR